MTVLMFYQLAADGLAKVPEHFAAHRGRLVGALAVFTSREAADDFARDDPFVVHGIVSRRTLHDWDTFPTDRSRRQRCRFSRNAA